MIKRVVHIDQNFPRRFSEQADKPGPNHDNWGFDTHAASDDLNGEIDLANQGSGKIDSVSQSTYVDQLYDDLQATDTQLANLDNDEGQIRFNANVFNYIVHTEIDNIILKYDSPVVYAEGVENKYTGEFTWKEKYIVLDGYKYQIKFDILMHDPIGVDAKCYEAYIGDTRFGRVDRKSVNNTANVDPIPHEKSVIWSGSSKTSSETVPITGKFITVYDKLSINKLPDKYSEDDNAFKVSVQLSGMGYTDTDINTQTTTYDTWLTTISDEHSTEQQIIAAWEACEGVKFKFFDVAGNVTYWVMPYIEIVIMKLEDLYNIKKLLLEFINTHPADLQLGTDLIGRTTIKVTNPNSKLSDCDIIIELDKASLGELYKNTRKEKYITIEGKHIAKIATEDVGNIDDSGWVIAHAMIDIPDFTDDLDFARIMVRNLSRADGSLGEWIKECSDNLRKLTLDPFVPQYLKETTNKNSAYYKFVKFTERYLNTMFKAYDKNCYISVLEAIARIGNFNDYTTIYKNLLDKYDNDHGDMLHITADELNVIINADRQEPAENETEPN